MKTKTAEEFLNEHSQISHFFCDKFNGMVVPSDKLEFAMVGFAKYHVKKTLEAVKEKGLVRFTPWDEESWEQKEITRGDILEFYGADIPEDKDYCYEELRNRDGFTIEIDQDSIDNAYDLNQII